ncbi:MAG: RNA polymerase primary sigma factor [Saprospiraceae bacterium]|jgi:RNA polymerase primary sigma factor
MRQLKITQSITKRDGITLDKYLSEIAKEDLITAQEEVELAVKIRAGDERALEKLTKANLRFVVSVSKQYQGQGLTLPDLINEGNLGLIKAAKKFDETRGFKFISYAVWWIRQSIIQAISEQSRLVRLPLNKIGSLGKIRKGISQLEQQLEREPNAKELSDYLELTEGEVETMMKLNGRHISVDAPFAEGENHGLLDVLEDASSLKADQKLMEESLKKEINRTLAKLPDRESEVVKLFFGIDGVREISLDEIGTKFNLTRERVRQIKEKAIKRLRNENKRALLKVFLG